jgi:hypothetical protein
MGTHWRSMMDRNYLGSWDLPEGRDVPVRIREVRQATELAGKKTKKFVLFFDGKEKGLVGNATAGKTMQGMYGPMVEDWRGKWIALYVTTTSSPEGEVPCVRIRPTPPKGRKVEPEQREPGSDDAPAGEAA